MKLARLLLAGILSLPISSCKYTFICNSHQETRNEAQTQTASERKKQGYLDNYFEKRKEGFPCVNRLVYVANPEEKAIEKTREWQKKYKGRELLVFSLEKENFNELHASVMYCSAEVGKSIRSDIFIFPPAFELDEKEFIIVMVHENRHCEDVFYGIKINEESFETAKISPRIFNKLFELRAQASQLEHLLSPANLGIRKNFIKNSKVNFFSHYAGLSGQLEEGNLSDYEKMAIEKHLKHFEWHMKEAIKLK